MDTLNRAASTTSAAIRYLATGQTRSRKDRRALASYWRYQADARKSGG
jgi:hypothetical protein